MKVVVQRVAAARVEIDGKIAGEIGHGLLLLVGFEHGDGMKEIEFLAEKILHLRIFPDEKGKMNRSVLETGGQILSISQFTLAGDTRKGRRPDFTSAAPPETATDLYDRFNRRLSEEAAVETGVFGAMMEVHLVNTGPVTLILEKRSSA